MEKFKYAVYAIVERTEQIGSRMQIFDIVIISLIISNSIAVVAEPSIRDADILYWLRIFEIFSVAVFTVEYLLRVWVADLQYNHMPKWKARMHYVVSPIALIDVLAVLPFYIPFLVVVDLRVLRLFRIFRLLRILKMNRYTTALVNVVKVLKNKAEQLVSSFFVIIVLMIIASVLMFDIENNAQPDKFVSVFDAMWWSVSTLTTVGYGDIYPITAFGKVMAAIIAILGVGIVSIPTGIIASGFIEQIQQKKASTRKCPHCGRDIDD